MMRLIDANLLIAEILKERDKIKNEKPKTQGELMCGGIRKALHCIENAPTIDAAPVVHGQ